MNVYSSRNRLPALRWAWSAIAALLLALSLTFAGSFAAGAQSARSAVWDRYDVRIELEPSGALVITERFDVAFSGSTAFSYGFADIPLRRIESIDVLGVWEETGGDRRSFEEVAPGSFERRPGTYVVTEGLESVFIEYAFTPAVDEVRSFAVSYRANGALRVYGDGAERVEQIWWNAISTEVTDVAPVHEASVTIVLPEAVPLEDVVLGDDAVGPADAHTDDGKTWRWEQSEMGAGDDFVVRMQIPALTSAEPPSWQAQDDCERANERRGIGELILLGLLELLGLPVEPDCAP